jgi:hypothetical protein
LLSLSFTPAVFFNKQTPRLAFVAQPRDNDTQALPQSTANREATTTMGTKDLKHFSRTDDGALWAVMNSYIEQVVPEAISIADAQGAPFTFEFNGVDVTVEGNSDAELIVRDWWRASRTGGMVVGPHPNPVVTDEEQKDDRRAQLERNILRELQASRAHLEAAARFAAELAAL